MVMTRHKGSCHCGRVEFEVEAPPVIEAIECNCSICQKTGFLHLMVPENHFHLLKGQDFLKTYTFNTHKAKHLFCTVCGVKAFYRPRSHPHYFSVNVRCLDMKSIRHLGFLQFDGANWEDHRQELEALIGLNLDNPSEQSV